MHEESERLMAGTEVAWADRRHRLIEELRLAGCVFAEDEADAVLAEFAGRTPEVARPVPGGLDALIRDYVRRRRIGEPSEYIRGWAEVAGIRVRVGPGVFIPRRWSEALVLRAVSILGRLRGGNAVDLGTGSGALALAVQAGAPDATIWATEIDPVAAEWARLNSAGSTGLKVCTGDMYDGLPPTLRHEVDVIFGSLPYVPTEHLPGLPRDHVGNEPVRAFDGGQGGLVFIEKALEGAGSWLRPGGHVLLELGTGQGDVVLAIAAGAGLKRVSLHRDDYGDELFVDART
jgi:release factor glutamine methyltransferase